MAVKFSGQTAFINGMWIGRSVNAEVARLTAQIASCYDGANTGCVATQADCLKQAKICERRLNSLMQDRGAA